MNNCGLNNLPVELIHHLLSYFSAHEIFYTFINVTSYIDAVLATYSNYRINFKAISRINFELICQYIVPDQVVALTLSNDDNTPGLIDLFLSRFQIKQFTHLQSLKLFEIGPDFWQNIITQMVELKYLRSFCFFPSNRNEQWICNLLPEDVTQLDKSMFDSYAPILPQLYQLRLCHGDFLNSIQFPYLRHLIIERSSVDICKHICFVASQLKSFETSFKIDELTRDLIFTLPQLNRLILQIQGMNVSMNTLEKMMSNLPCLKHLELITNCNHDVVNGQRWQTKVKNLVTFKFTFHVSLELESQAIDSFRTSFWLEEKHWFVAYAHRSLFSVPHFIQMETDENFRLPQYSTVPNNRIFYEHIHKLQLRNEINETNDINFHFPYCKILVLRSTTPPSYIEKFIDVNQIQNLILMSVGKLPVKHLINKMSNLRQISIGYGIDIFLKQIHYVTLDKIRTLQISNNALDVSIEYNIEHLCTVFPNIERLQVNHKCSNMQIFDFLDRFKHLSTASFCYMYSYDEESVEQCHLNIQSALDRIRRVQRLNYTYRFDYSFVHLWI